MSAARVIPFPVRARSQHEISGPRAGVMNRPEEREPSPGSAWPWITFTGAAAKGSTMIFRRWVTPGELMERWVCWPFQLAEAWLNGLPVYSSINGVQVVSGSSCLECTSGSINGGKACDDEYCRHAWTYEGFCHESGMVDEDYYRADIGTVGHRIANGAFTFDLAEVEAFEQAHGIGPASKGYGIPSELAHQGEEVEVERGAQAARTEAKTPKELTPKELVSQMNAREAGPSEIIAEIESRWPKMLKYRVGAFAKGLDPDDQTTRKQAEAHYQRHKRK